MVSVRVTSPTAANSPQVVTATLEVLPAGQTLARWPAGAVDLFPHGFQQHVGVLACHGRR